MGKLTYLVIHTSDTPFNREVTPDDIAMWHLGALKNSDGTYTYLGKKITKKVLDTEYLTLPSGKKIKANQTVGRGWSVTGYADMIQRNGKLINLNPYDFDEKIDQWEVTNGVAGKNSVSRNIVLVGGWSADGKIKNGHVNGDMKKPYLNIKDLYTTEQIQSLVDYVNMQLEVQPDLIVCGHNQLSTKTCPNFWVPDFIKEYNIKARTL
jgi:hypothetical protein